jgi:large subunit ribosomal protein L1
MNENILKAVQAARASAKKRNFSQSFDLIVNLKLIDLKKPENRINEIFALPEGRGKDAEVVLFSDGAKDAGCTTYNSNDIDRLARGKREVKKIANSTDFFLSEPKLMPTIGKTLGRVLAPRGKMPAVVATDQKAVIERHKKSVRIKLKDSPVIQCTVGIESMKDEDVAENIEAVLNFLEKRLPKGKNSIGKSLIKLTMGRPSKVEI